MKLRRAVYRSPIISNFNIVCEPVEYKLIRLKTKTKNKKTKQKQTKITPYRSIQTFAASSTLEFTRHCGKVKESSII